MEKNFHFRLKSLIHEYIIFTYKISRSYPDEGKFGLTSQDRRVSVSVMLNYIEGYGRMSEKVTKNFFEISYGSLQESIYVKFLAKELSYISEEEYKRSTELKNEIGAMLYSTLRGLKKKTGQ